MKINNRKICLILMFLSSMLLYSNAIIKNTSAYSPADFPNVPIGACFSYSVQTTNRTTHELKSLTENFACKAITINGSGVVVLQRWNMTEVATNDSLYSHYYICEADITTLSGMFTPEQKIYGGIAFTVINVTSGVIMTDSAHYNWYIYDTETGLALEGYKDDVGQDIIIHSWLTFYSSTCNLDDGDPDVPGYEMAILSVISVLAIGMIIKKIKKN